jgi:hypothetical protein
MKSLTPVLITVLVIASSSVSAGKGPKGGPSFMDYEWTEIVATDFDTTERWEPRAGLQAVEFHNHLFVIAGRTPSPTSENPFASFIHGDVWVSPDLGETWVELLEDAESAGLWKNRAYFEAVTKGGYIYVMGGQNFGTFPFASEFFKDVWRSSDGLEWEQMTDDAEWARLPKETVFPDPPCGPPLTQGRAGLSAVNFKGRLWVLGGSQGDDLSIAAGPDCRQVFNDVWYSRDGSKWHLATDDAPWEARAGGVALVKGGWLYYMGGEKGFTDEDDYFNDVWRTKDGMTWEEVTGPDGAGWSPRPGHKCSVLANHFVCMGGFAALDPFPTNFDTNPSDIWVSKNGADWEQVSDSPWNNDPSHSDCIFAIPPELPIVCDDIRYDFDMLTVSGGKGGMKPSIFTFGGDREVFVPIPGNEERIENDVWRYSPKK